MEMVSLTRDGQLLGQDNNSVADALTVLPNAMTLANDCTLRSFFSLLIRYPVLQKLSEFLPAALADMEKCPPAGCLNDDMPGLVFGKTMELIGFPGKPRAELYLWLRGLQPGAPLPSRETAEVSAMENLGTLMAADREIRFIPLQILLDTPLFLGGLKHVVLGDVNRHLYCETRFTLFEVVDGLAWELGFQGGTQQCSIGR